MRYGWSSPFRMDPGRCIICGVPHCACTGTAGNVSVPFPTPPPPPTREPPAGPAPAVVAFSTVSYPDVKRKRAKAR